VGNRLLAKLASKRHDAEEFANLPGEPDEGFGRLRIQVDDSLVKLANPGQRKLEAIFSAQQCRECVDLRLG
jgi:hypothetical protein